MLQTPGQNAVSGVGWKGGGATPRERAGLATWQEGPLLPQALAVPYSVGTEHTQSEPRAAGKPVPILKATGSLFRRVPAEATPTVHTTA